MTLKEQLRAAREKLRSLIKRRHDAPPGSDKRKELAGCVREARLAKEHAAEAVKAAKKPDFNGHPSNVTAGIRAVVVRANRNGLYVTSTTGGTHSPTSYHYSGRAVDVAAPMTAAGVQQMIAFQRKLAQRPGAFVELFGPANDACVKNGQPLTLAEGTALEQQHDNHVHVAV